MLDNNKLLKSIKGLEEKIERLKTQKQELGSKQIYDEMDQIDSFLHEKIKVIESLQDGTRFLEPNLYDEILKQCSPTKEVVEALVVQMSSPGSVWKRTSGSIGVAVSREDMGMKVLNEINL